MAIKNFKPTSPARRYYSVSDFQELTKGATPQ
jgi:ribosomal protein L2